MIIIPCQRMIVLFYDQFLPVRDSNVFCLLENVPDRWPLFLATVKFPGRGYLVFYSWLKETR